MTNIIESSSKSLALPQDLTDLKKQAKTEWLVKSLFATAVLIVGICAVALLGSNFLAAGIAVILISSLAIYQYFNHYRHSRNVFIRAARAITQSLS